MPPQLKRLLPAFIIFILLFLVLKYYLTPETFGEKGHYRYSSIAEVQQTKMKYAGKDKCNECHDDKVEELGMDFHADLSCEVCHGPGLMHAENDGDYKILVPTERELCALCHSKNISRSTRIITQINILEHNTGKKCIDCHNPHMPWELKE